MEPLPIVDIVWQELIYLNLEHGLGAYLWNLPNLQVGLGLTYSGGREEDDADHLMGLGDVSDSIEISPFIRLNFTEKWSAGAQFRRDISGGHEGTLAELDVGYRTPLADKWRMNAGAGFEWADQDYMESFFGVSAAQASASGLSQFNADAALKSIELYGGLNYAIDRDWFAQGFVSLSLLTGDAADSPVTESDTQLTTGVGVGYDF